MIECLNDRMSELKKYSKIFYHSIIENGRRSASKLKMYNKTIIEEKNELRLIL